MQIKRIKGTEGIQQAIKDNDGYCICRVDRNEDTKCICKDFLRQEELGECHCGLYEKIEF